MFTWRGVSTNIRESEKVTVLSFWGQHPGVRFTNAGQARTLKTEHLKHLHLDPQSRMGLLPRKPMGAPEPLPEKPQKLNLHF